MVETPAEVTITESVPAPAPPADSPPQPMESAPSVVLMAPPAYIPPPEVQVTSSIKNGRSKIDDKEDGYISSLTKNAGIDPDAKVQTGPGLPSWQWRSHELRFDGPVTQEQEIHLWLLPPWASKLLVVLRLVLLALLLLCVGQAIFSQSKGKQDKGHSNNRASNTKRNTTSNLDAQGGNNHK